MLYQNDKSAGIPSIQGLLEQTISVNKNNEQYIENLQKKVRYMGQAIETAQNLIKRYQFQNKLLQKDNERLQKALQVALYNRDKLENSFRNNNEIQFQELSTKVNYLLKLQQKYQTQIDILNQKISNLESKSPNLQMHSPHTSKLNPDSLRDIRKQLLRRDLHYSYTKMFRKKQKLQNNCPKQKEVNDHQLSNRDKRYQVHKKIWNNQSTMVKYINLNTQLQGSFDKKSKQSCRSKQTYKIEHIPQSRKLQSRYSLNRLKK